MKLKKIAPAHAVLSCEERKRLADFVMLLATIDRRLKTKTVCFSTPIVRPCAPKAQEKKDRKAKGIYKPSDIGPPKKLAFVRVTYHTQNIYVFSILNQSVLVNFISISINKDYFWARSMVI